MVVVLGVLRHQVVAPQLVFRPESCRGGDGTEGGGLLLALSVLQFCLALRHFKDHLHVVGPAPASRPPVEVLVGGGGDEVVLLARGELQGPGCGGEGSEGDGEVHEGPGPVADRHYPRPGTAHSTRLELLPVHAVDDVLLLLPPLLPHHGADEVHLVVLPRQITLVDHDSDGVPAEAGRGRVPVHIADFGGCCSEEDSLQYCEQDHGWTLSRS